MNRRKSVVDKAAEQLVNMDNANYADERERSVYLEAQAFGMQLTMLTCWLAALVFAIFGQVLTPLALIVLPTIPALGAQWFATRRGVSTYRLMARGPVAKTMTWTGFYGLLLFGASLALTYRAYYGEGLVDFAVTFDVVGEELQYALAVGAILGMGLAALVAVLTMGYLMWHHRRSEKRELEENDDTPTSQTTPATTVFLLIVGALVALLGLIPIVFGPPDHFGITVAVLGLLYGVAMVGLHLRTRKLSASKTEQD